MRQTVLWPHCARCEHRVNPRSEICEEHHLMCTPTGCVVEPRGWPTVPMTAVEAPRRLGETRRASQTTFLVDLASYQQGIDLAAVKAAGFTKVNIKLTQGNWYVHTGAAGFARQARDLGLGILTFSWIDNSASGTAQADFMWRQLQAIGGPAGIGHQVDCEDPVRPATFEIWRDYVRRVKTLMGRAPINYSGDWWWMPRNWIGAGETPYMWAGPNAGYLANYPGDTSIHWAAGYGGWDDYAALQYAVQPIANAGGGNLSKTAIRDPAVWAALTGGDPMAALSDKLVAGLEAAYVADYNPAGDDRINPRAWVPRAIEGPVTSLRAATAELLALTRDLAGRPPVELTDEQAAGLIQPLVEQLTAVLVEHNDVPITAADAAKVAEAVQPVIENALGNLVLRAGREG